MSIVGVEATGLQVAAQATPTPKERLLALTNFLAQAHLEQTPRTQPVAEGHFYSILGKSAAPLLPTPLLPTDEAIRQLDAQLVKAATRNSDPSQLEKWNSFKQEALENKNHLLYDHVESIRAREFQEDVNLFLVAVNTSLEKNPAELDTVLFLLTSELDMCRPGILGRFHNSVWPIANNTPLSSELPYLTLRMIDDSKIKVLEEIVSGLFKSEVHLRNALYQAENNRFGLGLREDQLGADERVTPFFIQHQGIPGMMQSYGGHLKKRFQKFLSLESIPEAAAPFYAHKASQEKAPFYPANLIQGLLHFYDMNEYARNSLVFNAGLILQNTPLFQQICKDLAEGVLYPELTIDKELNTAFQDALGILNMEQTLERVHSDTSLLKDVISKAGVKSLINELFYEETGSFNEFALLFILKYSGMIEEIPAETNLSTLKGAFLAEVHGKQMMIEALATALSLGRLLKAQVPEAIVPLDLEYYRTNPAEILKLSAAVLARLSPEELEEFIALAYTQITEELSLNSKTPSIFKMCPKFVLAAVTQNGWALADADAKLKKNRVIVLAAVTKLGIALADADAELKKDLEIVLAAITQCALALNYADAEFKKNRDIVLIAVTKDGRALGCVDPELRKDPKIVLPAVTKYGLALRHADAELRKNPDIVLVAVTQDGMALEYADAELKRNITIVSAALRNNRRAAQYVDPDFQTHPDYLALIQELEETHG